MKIFAVCDTELNYARRLAERMDKEKEFLQVQVFDTPEAVLEYAKKNFIEVLVMAEEFADNSEYKERFRKSGISNIFLLTSDDSSNGNKAGYRCFCKYQAASKLIGDMALVYRQILSGERSFYEAKKTLITGVFSPVHCVEKTVWALLAGLIIAKDRPVLYVNMERYAGFDSIFGRSHVTDLSETFYHIMHGCDEDADNVTLFENYRGLSYIPPIRFSRELDGMTEETVRYCIERLTALSEKGVIPEKIIILDFSGSVCGYRELFNLCDKVFLTYRGDCMTLAAVESFEEEYRIITGEELPANVKKEHIHALKDSLNERFLELSVEGELGRAIEEVLRKEGLLD